MQKNNEIVENTAFLYAQPYQNGPIRRLAPKVNRNELCSINNIKFKKCCGIDGSNFCKKLLTDYLNEIQQRSNDRK